MQFTTISTYGRAGGSARVRLFDWIDWLGLQGHFETYLNTASNSPSILLRRPIAVAAAELRLRQLRRRVARGPLVISRQASPFSQGVLEAELLRVSSHGVYDFDDALYLQGARGRLSAKSRVWRNATAAADVVIAGNPLLAEHAAERNPNTVVIPSCVDPDHYEVKSSYALAEVPRAVWIGSPSTEKFLQDIADALLHVHRTTGLRLTVISAGGARLGALDTMIDRVRWQLTTFASELTSTDFGLMPLPDTDWTRGKCAYKLLQYGAAGLPLIGSPVGANRTVLELADGLTPTTTDDWIAALQQMIDESAARRAERGERARAAITSSYSYAAWADTWRSAVGLA